MEITLKDAAQLLDGAGRLVLTGHIHPDGDCLGSMLALGAHLRRAGKTVEFLLDDDIPAMYDFMPGVKTIARPDGPRRADLLVVLDASDVDRILSVREAVSAKILNLDHHISNTKFADYWHVDSRAAATGEIVLELIRLMDGDITEDIAVNLYTAIATDCGFFRYANTTAATLRYAADLIDAGAQPHLISENLETKPVESIMSLRKVLASLELYRDGKIAAVTVADVDDGAAENTEGFINYPRNIEGVEIAIMFKPADAGTTRVSLRSRTVDVSRLALSFGGGGHARAAGCTVEAGLAEATARILAAAGKLLEEAGQ